MEDALSHIADVAKSNNGGRADIVVDTVTAVPGARILRNALSTDECKALSDAIISLHVARREEVSSSSADTQPRRASQHHIPIRVDRSALAALCARLRSFFPQTIGPKNTGCLEEPGLEISAFLRCYYYQTGDYSMPHYDRSYVEYPDGNGRHGAPSALSAYSLLFYLNDDFEGGHTTFFTQPPVEALTRSKLTLASEKDRERLHVVTSVEPRLGDALIFPHGNYEGAHDNAFHEGSQLLQGHKVLLRTDIVFRPPAPRVKSGSKKSAHIVSEVEHELESVIVTAVSRVCPELESNCARGTFRRIARPNALPDRQGVEYLCDVATKVFHVLRQAQGLDPHVDQVRACDNDGVGRLVTKRELAQAILDAIPPEAMPGIIQYIALSDRPSGSLYITSASYAEHLRAQGFASCTKCARCVRDEGDSMDWHMKSVHGL